MDSEAALLLSLLLSSLAQLLLRLFSHSQVVAVVNFYDFFSPLQLLIATRIRHTDTTNTRPGLRGPGQNSSC